MFQEIRIYFGEAVTVPHILDDNSEQACDEILLRTLEETPAKHPLEEEIWAFRAVTLHNIPL